MDGTLDAEVSCTLENGAPVENGDIVDFGTSTVTCVVQDAAENLAECLPFTMEVEGNVYCKIFDFKNA